jgi:hypothetical protein
MPLSQITLDSLRFGWLAFPRLSAPLPGCIKGKGKWVQIPHDRVTVSGELLSPGRLGPSVTLVS